MRRGPKPIAPQDRFMSFVHMEPNTGCWLWCGSLNNKGYGQFGIGSEFNGTAKLTYAHRFAWEMSFGKIPNGMCVLHKCDVPACANPAHLFLGTQAENMIDMHSKGRRIYKKKTHCNRGHQLIGENVAEYKNNRRVCRACQKERRSKKNKLRKQVEQMVGLEAA